MSPLQTDLYQLAMAAACWQAGKAEQDAFDRYAEAIPDNSPFTLLTTSASAWVARRPTSK